MKLAYIGLGAMGRPMAANLARWFETLVWNRTGAVAREHADAHGSSAVERLADLAEADVVCSCLPTSREVAAVAGELGPALRDGTTWIDHTSGDPATTRDVAAALADAGVSYLDAPVSGGTDGAETGRLTVMVGGEEAVLERVAPVLDAVASRVVHVGPVGSGMAVKAVNNALLATSLRAAGEGLLALRAAGVDPSTALEVINASSGRSFATERLIPERVITRRFPPTFALVLLAKDVGIATQLAGSSPVDGRVLELVGQLTADAVEQLGPDADHTELVRALEDDAGMEL